jgi:hypothetical protein
VLANHVLQQRHLLHRHGLDCKDAIRVSMRTEIRSHQLLSAGLRNRDKLERRYRSAGITVAHRYIDGSVRRCEWRETVLFCNDDVLHRQRLSTDSRRKGYFYLISATVRGTIMAKSLQLWHLQGLVPVLREILNCDATCALKC